VDAGGNALLQFLMHAVVEAPQPVSNMIIFRVRDRQAIVGFHKRILVSVETREALERRALPTG
jgi:hypothetical protein